MAGFGPDTSVIVAALCSWHDRHDWAREALEKRVVEGGAFLVAAHSLCETYSVLTRLPRPHRIAPAVAVELLELNLAKHARIVGMSPKQVWALIRGAPERHIAGGRTYDALIAQTFVLAGATEILTLNRAHFEPPVSPTLTVISP